MFDFAPISILDVESFELILYFFKHNTYRMVIMRIFRFLFITNLILFLSTTNVFSQAIYIPKSYNGLKKSAVSRKDHGIEVSSKGVFSSNKFLNINIATCEFIFSDEKPAPEVSQISSLQHFTNNSDVFFTRINNATKELKFPTYTSLEDEIDIIPIAEHSNLLGLSLVDVVYIPKTSQYINDPIVDINPEDPSQTRYNASSLTLSGFFYVLEGRNNKKNYKQFQDFCIENEIPYIRGHRDGTFPLFPKHGYNDIMIVPNDQTGSFANELSDGRFYGAKVKYLGILADFLHQSDTKSYAKSYYNVLIEDDISIGNHDVTFDDNFYGYGSSPDEEYSAYDLHVYEYLNKDKLYYEQGNITRYLIPTNVDDKKIEMLLDKLNISRFDTPISNTSSRIIIEYK